MRLFYPAQEISFISQWLRNQHLFHYMLAISVEADDFVTKDLDSKQKEKAAIQAHKRRLLALIWFLSLFNQIQIVPLKSLVNPSDWKYLWIYPPICLSWLQTIRECHIWSTGFLSFYCSCLPGLPQNQLIELTLGRKLGLIIPPSPLDEAGGRKEVDLLLLLLLSRKNY